MADDRQNYGIKVSQMNHDVTNSGDEYLLFSSSWGNLPILKWGRFQKLLLPSDSRKLFDHSLGYVPMIVIWTPLSGYLSFERHLYGWDEQSIYLTAQNPGADPLNIDFYYYILGVDITKQYTAPIIKTGGPTLDNDTDYGIRIAKKGKDVSSTDMRDYAVHSATRSPMLHYVSTFTIVSGGVASFPNTLPYNPIFFGYQYLTAAKNYANVPLWISTTGFSDMSATDTTINMYGTNGSRYSVVLLKDPFTITDKSTEVTV